MPVLNSAVKIFIVASAVTTLVTTICNTYIKSKEIKETQDNSAKLDEILNRMRASDPAEEQ